jgi:hypothetical protein
MKSPVFESHHATLEWRLTFDAPALQEQMARLADTALIGGERSDATDHCLAGIARLSSEVKDASSYLPTYDQRTYAEVAALSTTPTFPR